MSPKVTDAYKEERRLAILEAALDCFSEKGYQAATVDDIARRLGVSKGSVYLYFSGKEEIYTRIMEERMQRTLEGLNAKFSGIPDASGKLRLFLAALRDQDLADLRRLLPFHLEFWLQSSRREELKKVMDAQTESAFDFLRHIVEEGIRTGEFRPDADAGTAAALIWAVRDGIALQFVGGGDNPRYRELMEGMEEMVFRYLQCEKKKPL